MKLYIVSGCTHYDGSEVISAFDEEFKAQEFKYNKEISSENHFDYYKIDCILLNSTN